MQILLIILILVIDNRIRFFFFLIKQPFSVWSYIRTAFENELQFEVMIELWDR